MSTNQLRGDAVDVPQITTHTVAGTPANGQVYTLTCNGKSVAYPANGTDTNTTIATALVNLLLTCGITEIGEATFTSALGVITSTSATAGVPYTFTTTATGTGTFVTAITQSSAGHWHWDDPTNWTLDAVPVASDDIFLTQTSTQLKYGLPASYLIPNSIHVDSTFTGQCGLPDFNPAGYFEYRQTYLKIAPTSFYFGENAGVNGGGGCSLFRIDKGASSSTAFQIYSTGNPATQGLPALWIKGANASDTFVIEQGFVGICVNPGETAQFTTLKTGYLTSPSSDVQLMIGIGCTCGAITQLGGNILCNANVTSLSMTSGSQGTFTLTGAATMGAAVIEGGTYIPKTTGTHTTVKVQSGGTLDHSSDLRAFTIGTLTLVDGCTFLDPAGTIVETNPIIFTGNQRNMTLDWGSNRTLTFNS